MKKVAVIGAGSMGTAVSILLAGNGHHVRMWSPFEEEVYMINTYREQKHKLPGARIPENVTCTTDLEETLEGSDLIILVTPSHTVRQSARRISKYIRGSQVISCFSKGIEEDTFLRMSEVINQEIPDARVVALSGPCHAEELAFGIPSAYVAASVDGSAAEFVQDVLISPTFRVYTNPDIVGVELGGAIKNVIALCAGISDGLGFGDNTKAALMTRGIMEMSRLGEAMGARPETFAGLSGIGDLIVTCTSTHSRNRRAGILIGMGKSMKEAVSEIKMVVEGITTTNAAYKLAKKLNISAPIIEEAYKVLFEGKDPRQAVDELMTRDKKSEM